ncbi:MAG: ureidoglycolate lyase [Cellvibrionaceae bacterium]|nr:ureidoglycolate lyase [Cellvibrionaceae bacterium]|tara:strand:- start:6648 stop:7169 length:522 start_codon:yes stop_codon:yes gene_type:complete
METLRLSAQPLTAEAFAPFGDVIEIRDEHQHYPINNGLTERYHKLASVDAMDEGGYPIINIFRSMPIKLPFKIEMMERHPLGSQSFTMLSGQPYLVVVAKAGELNSDQLQVFLAQPHQGVNYHKGTWHHYCLCLNQVCDFLVIDRGGNGNNCDEVRINRHIILENPTTEASSS